MREDSFTNQSAGVKKKAAKKIPTPKSFTGGRQILYSEN